MMWIKQVTIAGFGQFQDRTFSFGRGLQVVYGENESGKSTLRAFILGLLFGFPSRRVPEQRYQPQTGGNYGGTLDLVVDNVVYRLTRLGDQPVTLVNLTTGVAQPVSLLAGWLAPYDQDQYKQVFTFNQAELTALKTLAPADLNQQLQQVGLVGSTPWRLSAATLRKTADELYKPRGRKPELNQALQHYRILSDQVRAAQQNYPDYLALQTKIQQLQADQTATQRTLADVNNRQQQLTALRRQWPVYQQIQQFEQTDVSTPTAITAATASRFDQLTAQRTELAHSLAGAQQQLAAQPVDQESQGLVGFYLQHQTEFDVLEQQLPALQRALGQYQTLTAQATSATATYDAQRTAHPELVASLSPTKRSALSQLRNQLANQQRSRQERPVQPHRSTGIDWRLIAGALAIVVGMLMGSGLKWILLLAGLGLLGWFGYDRANATAALPAEDESANLTAALNALDWDPQMPADRVAERLATLAELQRAQAAVTTAEQQAAAQAATVWQMLSSYAFAASWLPLDRQQLSASVTKVTEFYQRLHQSTQHQELQSADFAYTQRQVRQLQASVAQLDQQLQELAASVTLSDVDALAQAVEQQRADLANQASLKQLKGQLTPAELTALTRYATISDLQAAIAELNQQQATQKQHLTGLTAELVAAQTQLKQLSEDGRYADLRQQQANLQTEITVLAKRWLTRQLGAEWIETALTTLTAQQLPAVLTLATDYFARLTRKRYNKINLRTDELVVTTAAGQQFKVAELSTATREQLYLALRLALITHLGMRARLPLMIDDGFVNFDEYRRQAAWDLLADVTADHQLIYFTNETAALTRIPVATVQQLN